MVNYINKQKDDLIVVEFIETINGRSFYNFKCKCGNVKKYRVDRVFSSKRNFLCKCLKNDSQAKKELYHKYILNAKKRNYIFNLSVDEFNCLISGNCHYCGSEPNRKQKANYYKNKHFYANGIDRKDNSVGYTLKNSVSCCIICNRAKRDLDYNIFIDWIKQIKKMEISN